MPHELILVGVSHHTAPIELRERLALSRAEAEDLLAVLGVGATLDGAFALSTCGRTELYAVAPDADQAESLMMAQLAHRTGNSFELAAAACRGRGLRVVEHLLRVASGLESVVLGEPEILGQLRRARAAAVAAGTDGAVIGRLVEHALATGRRVRHETDIGAGRSSTVSVALGLVRRHLGRGTDARALVLGSGELGAKAARALRAAGLAVTVVSGRGAGQEDLLDALSEADVVVSCTAAPHHLVPADALAGVVERRTRGELLVIDLAVPRDFDPAARRVAGVRLFDLDDLNGAVDATAGRRAAAVPAAETILAREVDAFMRWLAARGVVPTIKDLRAQSERAVLDALRRSELAAGADEGVLRNAGEAIVTRLLHVPTLRLRNAAEEGDGEALARCVRELFQLDAA